jgi:hypothetical protein
VNYVILIAKLTFFKNNILNKNRSKWDEETYANGSYTFIKKGSSIEDIKNLARPLVILEIFINLKIVKIFKNKFFKQNRVFFAGEATTYKYTSTVHGAHITGHYIFIVRK